MSLSKFNKIDKDISEQYLNLTLMEKNILKSRKKYSSSKS